LSCFRRNEKTGRRFWGGGGELLGTGDDGGLDRGTSSDHIADDDLGLDAGGCEVARVEEWLFEGDDGNAVSRTSTSWITVVVSTRLRLVGGASS
jgi:hypothetical protein